MVKEQKLHVAVKSNNLTNVLKVLDKYNKPKSRTSSNKSKKIDFDYRDNLGLTVIHHAARNGSTEILETLLVQGSPFEVFDGHGLRPISYACAEGHAGVVDYLLRWGSTPNRVSAIEYLTPLHLSAMYGYVEIVHLLLRYNADPFVLNKDNKSPLDLACAYGKYNVINLLFSFTTSLINKSQQPNHNFSDSYGPRTPQSDQQYRCSRQGQANVGGTPKVERYLTRRSSSPYGSTNSSSGGSSSYNTGCPKARVVRNISMGEASCHSPRLPHGDTRQPGRPPNSQQQHAEASDAAAPPTGDGCVPPTLDASSAADIGNDLRQNLREACFAVQARALLPFRQDHDLQRTISFGTGDLITVLKQFHNGVMKGFVTSEGISSTGLFPASYVEFINDNRPPICCDRPMEISVYQSPEKTPIPNRGRPAHLDLTDTIPRHPISTRTDPQDSEGEGEGSPIIIPPQMTSIRTTATTSSSSTGRLPRCTCDRHPTSGGCGQRPTVTQSPELPSVSISDLSYCLSLGPGLVSSSSSSGGGANKRNSIVSMDSGRGSATDSKSVVSGSTPASGTFGRPPPAQAPPMSPSHCCQSACRCPACALLPPTMPAPYHQSGALADGLYFPCSMLSLDDTTQYSSGSSDRGCGGDDVMVNWLHSSGLGGYADLLSAAGYDLATLTKATPEDLNASGITNPKDRQFMKTQLTRLSIYDGLPDSMPGSVHDFLDGLKLLQYEELLSKQNFTKIEHLLGLTWEDLADIGIQKLGHQKKLSLAMERLSRLSQVNSHCNNHCPPSNHLPASHSSSKFSSVPQSRSFEELPYPAAIMADQESRDSFQSLPYKGVKSSPYKPSVTGNGCGLLSKSDESVSSVSEVAMYGRHEDLSMSSSTSSCSQESGSLASHNLCPSSASHFAHDNIGTVRTKRSLVPLSQDCPTDPS